jgi:hypothetical protein
MQPGFFWPFGRIEFTIDTLVEMMSRIGKPVTLAVG